MGVPILLLLTPTTAAAVRGSDSVGARGPTTLEPDGPDGSDRRRGGGSVVARGKTTGPRATAATESTGRTRLLLGIAAPTWTAAGAGVAVAPGRGAENKPEGEADANKGGSGAAVCAPVGAAMGGKFRNATKEAVNWADVVVDVAGAVVVGAGGGGGGGGFFREISATCSVNCDSRWCNASLLTRKS